MAVTFTGSSYLTVASVPAAQTIKGSPFTLAIWVYPTSSGGTIIDSSTLGNYLAIVGPGRDVAPPPTFTDAAAIFNDSANGTWFLDLEQNEFTEELDVQGDATNVNAWVHYCATYSGSNSNAGQLLYKNGVLISNTPGGAALVSTVAWNDIVVGGFNGDAQDAWVFNRALSAAEVADLYLGRGQRVSTANIVGHWPLFADSKGLDISGQGRNLSTVGSVVAASRNAPTAQWGPGSTRGLRTLAVTSALPIIPAGTTNTTGAVTLGELAAITPAGTTNVTGAVTLTALKAITPAGTTNVTGAVTLGELAAVAPSGTTNTTGAVTLTASEALAPSGTTNTTGAVTLTAAEALAPSGTTNTTGAVTLTALKALAPSGTTNTTGAVDLGLTAPLATPAGTTNVTGAVAFGASAAIAPAGTTATTGSVNLGSSSALSLVPAGTTNVTGAVTLTESADLGSTAGATQTTGSVALTVLEALTPAGTTNVTGAVALGLTAPLATPAGTTQTTGSVQLGIGLQLVAAGTSNTTGAVTLAELAALVPGGTTNVTGAITMGKLIAFPSAGTTSCFGSVTLTGGVGPVATGGPFKGNVSRRTMYAGRRRMRIV